MLLKLLEGFGDGIGMDCSIIQSKKYPEFSVISTTDFFFPLVEDPYVQGKIACANVLSDMYALGCVEVDNMLMLLAASLDMTEEERLITSRLMMQGFNDLAKEAGTVVSGGQTVLNPWPIIGGVAQSMVKSTDFIMPVNAVVGDVLVLTKPLGTQVAVNLKQWMSKESSKWNSSKPFVTSEEVDEAYSSAMLSMSTLNRYGAVLMHKYKAHGATDVTGFGILGHASNLASNQIAKVSFKIDTLPILKNMNVINSNVYDFGLMKGTSAETSGGLLIALPRNSAESFIQDLKEKLGLNWGWIVGEVVAESDANKAFIVENPKVINV